MLATSLDKHDETKREEATTTVVVLSSSSNRKSLTGGERSMVRIQKRSVDVRMVVRKLQYGRVYPVAIT